MPGTTLTAGVNLLWCRPGEVGGSEEYLARQLVGLATVAPEIVARLVVAPGYPEAHPELVEHFTVVVGSAATRRRRSARILAEARSLPAMLGDVDVVHHAGGTMPVRSPFTRRGTGPASVLTIHDLQYLRFPDYFSATRRTYLRLRMPPSARSADVIAVPSDYVAGTVSDAFSVDRSHIVVVPHGVDAPDPAALPDPADLRSRYGLGKRRVLVFPAMTHPHKGHRFLVELLATNWKHDDLVLVLLGGRGEAEADLQQAIADRGVGARVVRPGRVPATDRDGLIALAEALVFPSQYEGFGAPVLEAMALGTPVITSDQAALPEVAGDAAVVLPLAADAWGDALGTVATQRADLIRRGRARAAMFTTEVSGAALAAAYHQAVGR
jgi:glycosyltransferase involved in cell wall biosynthesis